MLLQAVPRRAEMLTMTKKRKLCSVQEVQQKDPNAWKTHLMDNCKKYNKDGTTKPFEFGNGDSIAQHGKKSIFVTLKKEAKSTKLKVKKMKRQLRDAKQHHRKC